MTPDDAPRRARIARAKAAELEERFVSAEIGDPVDVAYLIADLALAFSMLADLLDMEIVD